MLRLVIARIIFVIGVFGICYMSGAGYLRDPLVGASLTIGLILFCELVIAKRIKSQLQPPLNARQKRIALLPWAPLLLLCVGALVAAILAPFFLPPEASLLKRKGQAPWFGNLSPKAEKSAQNIGIWEYKKTENAMTGSFSYYATLDTKQEFQSLPLATLEIRKSEELGNVVSILVQKLRICRPLDHCNILVRFDDEVPVTYSVSSNYDEITYNETLSIVDQSGFLKRLEESDRIRISQERFSQGGPFIEFSSKGFQPISSSAASK